MTEPTYFLACPIFEDHGFEGRLKGIPEDEDGIDLDFLKSSLDLVDQEATRANSDNDLKLKGSKKYQKLYRHVFYVVPTWSNPSGKVMSMARRRELVTLARACDALIIADDVYDMLRWPVDVDTDCAALPPPPPRLIDVDNTLPGQNEYGNACSNGSFSKLVGPGTRVSWVEGRPIFVDALASHGATKSGGSPGQMASMLVYQMLQSGALNEHLAMQVIPTYRSRYICMMQAIKKHLEPLGVTVTGGLPINWRATDEAGRDTPKAATPQVGGFFAYIRLPDDLPPAKQITEVALQRYSLKLPPGQIMTAAGDEGSSTRCETTFGRGIRLSWSWLEPEDIKEGVKRLAMVITDIRNGKVKDAPEENSSILDAT